jgi:hypothetical protein
MGVAAFMKTNMNKISLNKKNNKHKYHNIIIKEVKKKVKNKV